MGVHIFCRILIFSTGKINGSQKTIYFLDGLKTQNAHKDQDLKKGCVVFKMIQHSVSHQSCEIGMCNL